MCGIFLYINHDSGRESLWRNYRLMSTALNHRGPDTMGIASIPAPAAPFQKPVNQNKHPESNLYCPVEPDFFQNAVGFIGQHHLAIIDPGPSANQPFTELNDQLLIVGNGEIYNFPELRQELQKLGFDFKTSFDLEVAAKSYSAWGSDCFKHFNGDFALVIYDHSQREIIFARDRTGVKPLFYLQGRNFLAFASELKGLSAVESYSPELNERTAYHYLAADFPTAKTLNETFLKNIFPVPPAHWGRINLANLHIEFHRYWNPAQVEESKYSFDEAVAEFDHLLSSAVHLRLRSDMPTGSFLSGGLDSPSIVWHALQQHKLPTFSNISTISRTDESKQINQLAEGFKVNNFQHSDSFADFAKDIDNLISLQDEPFTTLNVYTQFKLLQLARNNGIKVILDGGGSDEYLAGYADYLLPAALDIGKPEFLSETMLSRYQQFTENSTAGFREKVHSQEKQSRQVSYIQPDLRKVIRGSADSLDLPLPANYLVKSSNSFFKNASLDSVLSSWMNKSIRWDNRYLDRSGVALGIEGRMPFQDHRLIEFALALPGHYILRNGVTKFILRQSMQQRLPLGILQSAQKFGFEFPFCDLLRTEKVFRRYFTELLREGLCQNSSLIVPGTIENEFKQILSGQSNNYNLWRVFNLLLWQRQIFKS